MGGRGGSGGSSGGGGTGSQSGSGTNSTGSRGSVTVGGVVFDAVLSSLEGGDGGGRDDSQRPEDEESGSRS